MKGLARLVLAMSMCAVLSTAAKAQDSTAGAGQDQASELAKKLANPVASLISVPFQYNYDGNYGPDDDGSKSVFLIQPVIPISLGEKWNLITRTIVPLAQTKAIPTGEDNSGLGDITQSFFFSPKVPVKGWILAAGPVGLYPTGSGSGIGGRKWGVGPTGLALKQTGGWTYGLLANHLWSVAGNSDRQDISTTFLQPFLSVVTKTKTTFGLNTEATYDWEGEAWQLPAVATVSQLLKIGPQIFQIILGARYWAASIDGGPEGWGARAGVTLLFPK